MPKPPPTTAETERDDLVAQYAAFMRPDEFIHYLVLAVGKDQAIRLITEYTDEDHE